MISQADSAFNFQFSSGMRAKYLRPSVDGSGVQRPIPSLQELNSELQWFIPKQVHGSDIVLVGEELSEIEADGLIGRKSSHGLAVFGGDCPALAIDTGTVYIGIAHCGWRGVVAGIVENLCDKLIKLVGKSDIGAWQAYVGPGICGHCYEVDAPVITAMSWPECAICWRRGNQIGLDLKRAIADKCEKMGLSASQIELSACCTYEEKKLHSYRREGRGFNQLLTFYAQNSKNS